jgi:mannosyltransferase
MKYATAGHIQVRTAIATTVNATVIVAAITGLALVLRLLYLGKNSLWSDEILSVQRASGDWFEGGTHMVAYHTFLHIWLNMGDSEATIRLLSVIFAVATIPVVYLLGVRLFSPATGLVASLLMAVNAYHIQYAQEARGYSLMILMASLSSLFFVLGLQKRSWLVWAAYVITSALIVYSHVFGSFVLLVQIGSLLFLHWRRVPWKWMLSVWVGMALMMDFVIRQTFDTVLGQVSSAVGGSEGGGLNWIPSLTLESIKGTLVLLTGNGIETGGAPLLIAYAILIALALVIGLAAWVSTLKRTTRRNSSYIEDGVAQPSPGALPLSWKITFLFMWLLLPILVLLGASLISPVFVPRYTLSTLPALALVTAVGIIYPIQFFKSRLSGKLSVAASLALGGVLAVILALSAQGVLTYYSQYNKEDWRGVTQFVTSRLQPGDGILFYAPWMQGKFGFYLDRLDLQLPDIVYMVPSGDWREFIYVGEMGRNPDREVIARYLPDHYKRVWLIVSHYTTGNRQQVLNEIMAALRITYPMERFNTIGGVRVGLYHKSDDAQRLLPCGGPPSQRHSISGTVDDFELALEAEDGNLISVMEVGQDKQASGGAFISATSGTNTKSPGKQASYTFTVPEGGTYFLWARLYGPNEGSDAIYIGIDGSWDRVYPERTGKYLWNRIESSNIAGDYGFVLDEGEHEIQVGHAELNAKLDSLIVSDDPNFCPE